MQFLVDHDKLTDPDIARKAIKVHVSGRCTSVPAQCQPIGEYPAWCTLCRFCLRNITGEADREALSLLEKQYPGCVTTKRIPAKNRVLNFGKHKGLTWEAVPMDYLEWAVRATSGGLATLARAELDRRKRLKDNRALYGHRHIALQK